MPPTVRLANPIGMSLILGTAILLKNFDPVMDFIFSVLT